jgi:small neutral amino acid transporter SnatA (MarC family)
LAPLSTIPFAIQYYKEVESKRKEMIMFMSLLITFETMKAKALVGQGKFVI